jgi:hypothetical protein
MLMAVYQDEAGVVDKVILTAENPEDAKRLIAFNDEFKRKEGSGTGRWPDGSGTGRYDNWTQRSDGLDYPGSYGVGEPAKAPLKPFEPFVPADTLKAGDAVRVTAEDGTVDPHTYTVSHIEDGKVYLEGDHPAYARDHVVQVVPPAVV